MQHAQKPPPLKTPLKRSPKKFQKKRLARRFLGNFETNRARSVDVFNIPNPNMRSRTRHVCFQKKTV